MKIIITEQQHSTLLSSLLDDMFKNYKLKYEGDLRNVYVDGNLLMQIGSTTANIDKTILNKTKEVLFYDSMKDFKDEVRNWVVSNFGVKKGMETLYGIQFKNLIGLPEPPKERKRVVKDKKTETPKKSEEQKKREREGYKDWVKYMKDMESKAWEEKQERIRKIASKINESKLDEKINEYFYELFDVDEIKKANPYDILNHDTGEEGEDPNRIVFYTEEYYEDSTCFRWYDCEYFNEESPAQEICPTVTIEYPYVDKLNGYFGDRWQEPFRKWFIENFDLPVKTVEYM